MSTARLAVISIVLALAAAPAVARTAPPGRPADLRIRSVDYDPGQVVRVAARPHTATQIVFAPDESVDHVALGDSARWEVAADRNVLFLKPKAQVHATNLIVTTSRGAAARSYVFELAAATSHARQAGDYVLRFRYPADAPARAQAAATAAASRLEQTVVALKLERAALEGPRNLAYSVQGPAALEPSEVSDNGRFTVLRFPGAQALPAIYTVSTDGGEALAVTDGRGEFVVVHGVAPGLRLRQGRTVLCIHNDAYRPQAAPSGAGAAADDVVRIDRETAR